MTSRWLVVFGMVVIVLLLLMAIFAPLISPYDPYKVNLQDSLQQPSTHHWMGTMRWAAMS